MKRVFAAVSGVLLLTSSVLALGPHEVLVLVNANSSDSEAVAHEFCRLRSVPEQNVIRLMLPAGWRGELHAITPEKFTNLIFLPACGAMRQRGIEDHILAWVYSCGFPYRVTTDPPVSLTGLTFLRNRLPPPKEVSEGRYVSPIFAGPHQPGGIAHLAQTFDSLRDWLGADMPLPAMMLGYSGARGNTRQEIIECLQRGRASDHTAPTGAVYFVTSDDIRSACRQWQYRDVVRELRAKGIGAVITGRLPVESSDIIGLMAGMAKVDPACMKGYRPGCMAEHLTSAAAIFDSSDQTKLSAWIRAGATASAGTVTEPLSIWTKFPHARFFVHYAAGCTLIESFYQAISCPLQLLLVGDPLAAPWAPEAKLIVDGLEEGKSLSGVVQLRARVQSGKELRFVRFLYLLEGRVIGREAGLQFDTTLVSNGSHRLRVVAYATGLVRHQAFLERDISVHNP
ncbi:MAG: TIGR03790 family protein [Kiritimatiellia bacterium]